MSAVITTVPSGPFVDLKTGVLVTDSVKWLNSLQLAVNPFGAITPSANYVVTADASAVPQWSLLVNANIDPAAAIAFSKLATITTDSLLGRDTAGTGALETITLNATLSMDGSKNLQRAALTGDVTATAGSNATTIANAAVTYAKIQNVTDARLLGRSAGSGGAPMEITVGTGLSLSAGALTCTVTGGATPALDNLASVAINTALIPASAGGPDFGSATKPWKDVYFSGTSGTPGTNNFKITGVSTSGTRVLTLADGNTTLVAGTMVTTASKLNVFAATSSAELAGVISDETGSGLLVFATSPTFTTSVILPTTITIAGSATIAQNTADGSDANYTALAGGGGFGNTRGGTITVLGNENASSPTSFTPAGGVEILLGNKAGASFNLGGGATPTAWLSILGSDGTTKAQGVYNNTTVSIANVEVLSDGTLQRSTSSARYKTNVRPLTEWRWLLGLPAYACNDIKRPEGRTWPVFLAEDVAKLGTEDDRGPFYAGLNADGEPDDVAYALLTVPLQLAAKDHDARIAALEARIH